MKKTTVIKKFFQSLRVWEIKTVSCNIYLSMKVTPCMCKHINYKYVGMNSVIKNLKLANKNNSFKFN